MEPRAANISREMSLLKERMLQHQYKSTPQRDEIADWIFRTHEHFTVEDLIASFRQQGKKVSQATAYRVIQMMLDLKLIEEHDFGKDYKFYEHTPGHEHHDHIVCIDCGKIIEFADPSLESLKEKITLKNGFRMKEHHLTIYAECTNCPPDKKILTGKNSA